MAGQKKTSKKSSSSNSSSSRSGLWGLNKISFWTIVAITILYAVSVVLAAIGGNNLMTIATAIMIIIVAILAWRYVRAKQMVWKVLYIICLLIVIAGIIVPLVL